MAHDTIEKTDQTRPRNPLTWVVVAVAAGAAAIGLVVALTHTGSNPAPDPGQPDVVIHLTGPAGGGRCIAPNADLLSTKTLAFAGTVDSVEDGTVSLTPTQFYAGGPADQVVLRYPARPMDGAIDLAAGEQVLIAADAGQVMGCGFSGAATDDLTALYDQAFGG